MSTKAYSSRKKKARPVSTIESPAATTAATSAVVTPTLEEDEEEDISFGLEDSHTRIASCQCTIVGIRYYNGTAHAGEYVSLVREPSNPYDGNAIRVDNLSGQKVGHIKKEQARILAPFMDRAEGLSLEGTIPRPGNTFSMPCTVEFLAQAPVEELAERSWELAIRLEIAFKRQYAFRNYFVTRPASAAALKVEAKRMDWSAQAKELDQLFEQQTAQQLLNLPEVAIPKDLKTELLPFQKQGLQWMLHHDTTPYLPFYEKRKEAGREVWHCRITNSSQANKPKPIQGGCLLDEMGCGKTLQTIALLLAANKGCTLIVCPVSVMANWQQQIEQHVKEGVLSVAIYQGANRASLLPQVENGSINVLLTSYNTLSSEFSQVFGKTAPDAPKKKKRRRKDSIFDCQFHRIVLDETHIIRNSASRTFQAVHQIQATRQWCLTGTPFVNRSDDCYSLLRFLGVEPLSDQKIFKRAISIPMQQGDDAGLACLRMVLAHVALRRSKASANIKLVDKTVLLQKVSFPEGPHKTVYDALFGTVRTAFRAVLQDGDEGALRNYSNIFEKLLRLRQACCSAHLVPSNRRERALEVWNELQKRGGNDPPKLTAKEGLALLEKLKGAFESLQSTDELPECAVCLMEMEESQCVILRTCSHVYCEPCIGRVCSGTHNPNCPLCRKPFAKKDMIKKSMASTAAATRDDSTKEQEENAAIDSNSLGTSPKIAALLETIQATMQANEKGVIFSQFTSFLDLIQAAMKKAGHMLTRLDGSMSSAKRIEAVRAFSSEGEDSPRFILCSLHAAGTGINLTRGSAAFMMDCWWNTAVENQAMDRIHRIGQTRSVTVHRFVMKDSLEERIVALQEVKSMQAKGAMQKLSTEEKRKTRLSDLKGLLMIESD